MPAELLTLLRSPACYPHPTGEIRFVETHISWVVLTGRIAYKIKKPVRLDFLDFSTLERRRYFCEEELRLNRRFAPQLYLGLSRLTRVGDHIRIDATDQQELVIEYAVRLQEFPRSSELTRLIARGAIEVERLRAFGTDVAAVHREARPAGDDDAYGTVASIRRVVADNLGELARLELTASDRRTLATIARSIRSVAGRLTGLMRDRRRAGKVRECHGDLHAGNVVLLEDRLVAFDCIEFDPALRFIDIASDVAFLYMDLLSRDRPDLAYGFLDGWLERTGDYEGLEVLACYAAYRALVRAKVTILAAKARGKGAIDPGMGARKTVYLDLALRLLAPRRPILIVMVGMSGSGKSWLSQRIVSSLPAVRVRSDVERKRLAGFAADAATRSEPGSGIYTPEFNALTYERLIDCARHALRGRQNAILDAAFLKRAERTAALELAARLGVRCLLVACTAPIEVLRQRVAERAARATDASEATLEILERQRGYFESFTSSEEAVLVTVDTSRPDPEQRVLDAIAHRPG
jgi:aminoglycoside phosphotransferase family enzyme/predicted kinase